MTHLSNPQSIQYALAIILACVLSWCNLASECLSRQEPGTLSEAETDIIRLVHDRTATERRTDLKTHFHRFKHGQTHWWLKVVAVIIGMFTCVAGGQLLAARMGVLAVPASLAIAGGLVLFSDHAIVRANTNRRLREQTETALNVRLKEQQNHPPANQLGSTAHQAEIALIRKIEADTTARRFPIYTIAAVILNGAEFALNLYMVSLLGLPGGLLLQAIVSLIPLGIQLVAAVVESETSDFPKACQQIHDNYETYLWRLDTLSPADLETEITRILKLDLILKFLPYGDPSGRLKNLEMAEADFDIKRVCDRKQRLENETIKALKQGREQLRQAIAALPDQFSHPGIGLNNQQWQALRDQWVKQETERLTQEYAENQEWLRAEYGLKLQRCEQQIQQAWATYYAAEERWYAEQPDPGLPAAS